MKAVCVRYPEKSRVDVVEQDLPELGPGDVLVRSEVSLMSTGTENIILNALFDPGTHWANFVKFPYFPGYSSVGVVEEVGAEVERFRVGDRLVFPRAHRSHHVLPSADTDVVRVPSGISPEDASWFALARITHNGTRNAGIGLGDRVAVVGCGPIGQMMIRWAACCGAERVVAIDPMPARLDIARLGGATDVLNVGADAAKEPLLELLGELPNLVVDTTGHAAVLPHCFGLTAMMGRLLLIGDTGSPASQHLTPDLVTRGLRLIGAHYNNRYADRNVEGVLNLYFGLVASGRFRLDGMVTHEFAGADAEAAYRLVNTRRGETVGVLFRW